MIYADYGSNGAQIIIYALEVLCYLHTIQCTYRETDRQLIFL